MDPNNYKPRIMLPMLASKQGKGNIKHPCYIQPKLNGVCNLAEPTTGGKILHHSRGGKLFETVPHFDEWIRQIDPPGPLHGELYKHGWSLQTIGSYTKELKDDYDQLEFWVYDMAWLGHTFEERIKFLAANILPLDHIPIKLTPTKIVKNREEAKEFHDECIAQGFEGAMLKNINGLYMFEFNSKDIEKMKEFDDDEFEVIGGKQGTGLDEGCIIYRCKTKDRKEFDVRPKGTVEERRDMYLNLENDIGKLLTVRFAELSDDGVPLQPVGLAIRDYE
jgi:ATP-dependent DNA ligase